MLILNPFPHTFYFSLFSHIPAFKKMSGNSGISGSGGKGYNGSPEKPKLEARSFLHNQQLHSNSLLLFCFVLFSLSSCDWKGEFQRAIKYPGNHTEGGAQESRPVKLFMKYWFYLNFLTHRSDLNKLNKDFDNWPAPRTQVEHWIVHTWDRSEKQCNGFEKLSNIETTTHRRVIGTWGLKLIELIAY